MSSVQGAWNRRKEENTYGISNIIISIISEYGIIINFSDGDHKRIKRSIDTLSSNKTF